MGNCCSKYRSKVARERAEMLHAARTAARWPSEKHHAELAQAREKYREAKERAEEHEAGHAGMAVTT